MTPQQLQDFINAMPWSRRKAALELDISQDRLRRFLDGQVKIPTYIALACAALQFGLPPLGSQVAPDGATGPQDEF